MKMTRIVFGFMIATVPLLILLGQGDGAASGEKWAARYDGPGHDDDSPEALAVDGAGNVYVTGQSTGSGTDYDYATVKYNASGKQVWARRFNGPGNGPDCANAVALDGSGNAYVTGWTVVSGGKYDIATIKYDKNGRQVWVRRYDGPGHGDDMATALALDGSGNVYVTGGSYYSGSDYDYVTVKYSPKGRLLWARRYSWPGNRGDWPLAIVVDGSSNVYITGYLEARSADDDRICATLKYDPNGKRLWAQTYEGTGKGDDLGQAIAVDGAGNAYVTGSSEGPDSKSDYATIKYSPAGAQLWVQRYDGPGHDHDAPRGLVLDGAGNVYVTGTSYRSGLNPDYATIKYSPNGKQLWVERFSRTTKSSQWAYAVAVDHSGNVYVTGNSTVSGDTTSAFDLTTVKYNANGKQIWVKTYDGPGKDYDRGVAIAVDGSGHIYVTGESRGKGTSTDYVTLRY